ncbi:MAG TPA: hypothetical protein DEF61_01755 [Firmicutes bacterium]|nr:hypothetical protein [Bacillota bacterium]HBX25001.1 hypothetical protein [Bacillota bacterium]
MKLSENKNNLTAYNNKVEKELKKAIKNGDSFKIKEVFEQFYKCNFKLLIRVLATEVGISNELFDDAQEAFIVIMKNPTKLLEVGNIRRYLIKIAKNISLKRRESYKETIELKEEEIQCEKEAELNLDCLLDLNCLNNNLSEIDRKIVIMHVAYDCTFLEIANKLGIGEDGIYYRYKKAIKLIGKEIKKHEKSKR